MSWIKVLVVKPLQSIKNYIGSGALFLLILFTISTIFYVTIYDSIQSQLNSFNPKVNYNIKEKSNGYVVNTPGCKIPDMHPFDPQILKYIKPKSKIICNNGLPALFKSDLTSVYLINESLSAYNVTDLSNLECCYNVFWRMDAPEFKSDNKIQYSEECYELSYDKANYIDYDFIKVTCLYNKTNIYTDMFSFVPIKSIRSDSELVHGTEQPNVLIIGVDAVSRLNLHRQMPKTVRYLKEIGAIEMLGYNKVGDNTFPNLIPVLTGLNESELVETCWSKRNSHFDDCYFIWDYYKKRNYVTAFGEDASWMGLFNYQRLGFSKQPTDYGYNYFSRHAEAVIGNRKFVNVKLCEGSRLVYKDFQDYMYKFVTTMDDNNLPYFAFFWGVSVSHDDLNLPQIADDDYYDLFNKLNNDNRLSNTVVVFMSDHGIRWGGIRQTYQGRMEERLPFLFVKLPNALTYKNPTLLHNLVTNTKRLTTPFDLHETLIQLLDLNYKSSSRRSLSLLDVIPTTRTCADAGILSHWCTCQQSVDVDTNHPDVIKSSAHIIEYINSKLSGYAQCATLKLSKILNARLTTHNETTILAGFRKSSDYMVTLEAKPGGAIFEATVKVNDNGDLSVIGEVSRLNLYGKQSLCIADFHLKLYCFCKSLFSL